MVVGFYAGVFEDVSIAEQAKLPDGATPEQDQWPDSEFCVEDLVTVC